MAQHTYPHVEDYIEVIAGFKNVAGKPSYSIFQMPESLLSLARYDVKMLESLADQTLNRNTGYTDKQAKLAVDIILKYERQLAKHNISVEPVKANPQFRYTIRQIDRTSRVWIENNEICIRFPYRTETIEVIREQAKESLGRVHFDRERKIWLAELTEYNLNWAYAYSRQNNFAVDASVTDLMNCILEVVQQGYAIELEAGTELLAIKNSTTALNEYIEQELGGFSTDNLLTLVDQAPILGYTINKIIEEVVIEAYGTRFWSLCANRELKVDSLGAYDDQITEIVKYATATNRWPVYVYEPDLSSRITMLMIRHFGLGQVANLDKGDTVADDTRLVYCTKIPKNPVKRIPLLISGAGMMFGGDRQVWLQTAEKVVYFTKEIYNKNNKKGKEVCKLN